MSMAAKALSREEREDLREKAKRWAEPEGSLELWDDRLEKFYYNEVKGEPQREVFINEWVRRTKALPRHFMAIMMTGSHEWQEVLAEPARFSEKQRLDILHHFADGILDPRRYTDKQIRGRWISLELQCMAKVAKGGAEESLIQDRRLTEQMLEFMTGDEGQHMIYSTMPVLKSLAATEEDLMRLLESGGGSMLFPPTEKGLHLLFEHPAATEKLLLEVMERFPIGAAIKILAEEKNRRFLFLPAVRKTLTEQLSEPGYGIVIVQLLLRGATTRAEIKEWGSDLYEMEGARAVANEVALMDPEQIALFPQDLIVKLLGSTEAEVRQKVFLRLQEVGRDLEGEVPRQASTVRGK